MATGCSFSYDSGYSPRRAQEKDGFMSEEIRKNFASDNVTPICPEVMAALLAANEGSVGSYGADDLTQSLNKRFGDFSIVWKSWPHSRASHTTMT